MERQHTITAVTFVVVTQELTAVLLAKQCRTVDVRNQGWLCSDRTQFQKISEICKNATLREPGALEVICRPYTYDVDGKVYTIDEKYLILIRNYFVQLLTVLYTG